MNNAFKARRPLTADADPVTGPRPQAPRRIEFLPEPGAIDLRNPRTLARNLQEQEAEKRSRIRWSDQDNEPGPMPAKKPVPVKTGGGSRAAPVGLAILALVLAGGAAAGMIYWPGSTARGEVTLASASMTDVPILADTSDPVATTGTVPAPEAVVAAPAVAAPAEADAATAGQPAPPPKPVKTVKIAPPPVAPAVLPASTEPIPSTKSSRLPSEADPRWAVAAADPASAQRIFEAPPSAGGEAAIAAIKADDAAQPSDPAADQVQPSALVGDGEDALPAQQQQPVDEAATDATQTAAVAPEETDGSAVRAEAEPEPEPAAASASGGRTARISSGVNFRASRNGGRVVGTIPKGATVGVVSCSDWCEVTYKGRRGFVYKSFVTGQAAAPRARAQRSAQGKSRAPSQILSTTREQPRSTQARAQQQQVLPGVKTPAGTAP